MANWKTYRISDVVNEIGEGKYVLPVIQRPLVWTEEKMELLFDTLLKGDSFSGVIAIKEEKDKKPLFNYRPFTKTGDFIDSQEVETLGQTQLFIIDGQQRLQAFYIGLTGSFYGKSLYFDLYSNYQIEYEFKFEKEESNLPKISKEGDRRINKHLWYQAKILLNDLKETNDEEQVADEIIERFSIIDDIEKEHIRKNIKAFYKHIIASESLGISIVNINKSRPEQENRQRIVELFRRLNDGGTKLSSFDLVASILKGFDWKMEGFLKETLSEYQDIGLTQDNLIKLIFLLQDNHNKEMADIEAKDADFAINNQKKIQAALCATKKFLKKSDLDKYYQGGGRSFIPLFFIAYHLFHLNKPVEHIESYFDNFETANPDFPLMKKWLYHSLLNGVFRSRGAGWVSYRTGVHKLLNEIKNYKNQIFPVQKLFAVYYQHPISFSEKYSVEGLSNLDSSFVFYLIYDCNPPDRVNDIDHIMPKAILQEYGYSWDKINSIANYQLLDYSTNRGNKNGRAFAEWVNDLQGVKDFYLTKHLIPKDSNLWTEDKFEAFIEQRSQEIIKKINESLNKSL